MAHSELCDYKKEQLTKELRHTQGLELLYSAVAQDGDKAEGLDMPIDPALEHYIDHRREIVSTGVVRWAERTKRNPDTELVNEALVIFRSDLAHAKKLRASSPNGNSLVYDRAAEFRGRVLEINAELEGKPIPRAPHNTLPTAGGSL